MDPIGLEAEFARARLAAARRTDADRAAMRLALDTMAAAGTDADAMVEADLAAVQSPDHTDEAATDAVPEETP